MTTEDKLRKEIIQRFGDAYKAFGLNKLMGNIVALLIYSPEPLSLGEIAAQLHRSKGPVSQILRRLRDRKLIRKTWAAENNRKDYYEIEPEIFENAFRNNFDLIKNNKRIAEYLKTRVEHQKKNDHEVLHERICEMERFYELMEKHFNNFLSEWTEERHKVHFRNPRH
ncbi:MAG: GbsR/MarR family transcriptional regulator [Bacillota bacterium]